MHIYLSSVFHMYEIQKSLNPAGLMLLEGGFSEGSVTFDLHVGLVVLTITVTLI